VEQLRPVGELRDVLALAELLLLALVAAERLRGDLLQRLLGLLAVDALALAADDREELSRTSGIVGSHLAV
jgi:hypothetical protein